MGSQPRLFGDWLAREAPFQSSPDLACFAELDGTREIVESALQELIVEHLIGAEQLAKLTGASAAALAAAERIPKTSRQMSADFGEILAAAFVEECSDFRLPVRRLRYKADREFPMQGDDLVALAGDQSPRLLKGEAKSRAVLSNGPVEDADKALNARDGRPKPETLGFLSTILRGRDEDALAERVELFLDACDDNQLEHLLFTVSGNDRRDVLEQFATSSRPSIRRHVSGVVIQDHGQFIASIFESVRERLSAGNE